MSVPAEARARDAGALALLAVGAGIYAYAHAGLRALAESRLVVPKGEALVARWDFYRTTSTLGLLCVAGGVAVAAWSFLRYRKPAP